MSPLQNQSTRVSVRDLVEFVLRQGNLGGEREFVGSDRALAGIRGHQKIQRSRPTGYLTELPVAYRVETEEFTLQIRGRIDGLLISSQQVLLAATIPMGWMIGCPLLGFISDRLGRRKPVIIGGTIMLLAVLTWVLFGNPSIFRGHAVGILMGIASGAAMIPYSVIKEANPPELGGSATGVINFINFTFSALLGPMFGARLMQMPEGDSDLALAHYQAGFQPLIYGVILVLILTCFLKETGPAVKKNMM